MTALAKRIARFGREDDAHMIIEFVIFIPLIFTIFLTTVELGIYKMRQMFLDRGLDLAVRELRLGTGFHITHEDLRLRICQYAGFIENCEDQLKLEMTTVDLRTFTNLPEDADCTDATQPIEPSRTFVHGDSNEMMLLRACYKFDPVFATTGLGYEMKEHGDGAGMAKMIAVAAFVQEPT